MIQAALIGQTFAILSGVTDFMIATLLYLC